MRAKKVKARKYITTQMESYNAFGIEITRKGFVTDDPELIAKLDASPDLGFWFFTTATEEDTKAEAREWARKILEDDDVEPENDYLEPIEVEAVSAGNIDDELEALAEEEAIRKADEQAEEEAREAGRQRDLQYKERFRPNAAEKKKAALEKSKAKKAAEDEQ